MPDAFAEPRTQGSDASKRDCPIGAQRRSEVRPLKKGVCAVRILK